MLDSRHMRVLAVETSSLAGGVALLAIARALNALKLDPDMQVGVEIFKRALEDIATTVTDSETGASHRRYIQDRTVIEDTESSVDLVTRGW